MKCLSPQEDLIRFGFLSNVNAVCSRHHKYQFSKTILPEKLQIPDSEEQRFKVGNKLSKCNGALIQKYLLC